MSEIENRIPATGPSPIPTSPQTDVPRPASYYDRVSPLAAGPPQPAVPSPDLPDDLADAAIPDVVVPPQPAGDDCLVRWAFVERSSTTRYSYDKRALLEFSLPLPTGRKDEPKHPSRILVYSADVPTLAALALALICHLANEHGFRAEFDDTPDFVSSLASIARGSAEPF